MPINETDDVLSAAIVIELSFKNTHDVYTIVDRQNDFEIRDNLDVNLII